MKLKKRYVQVIAGLLILISGIFVVYAIVTATGGGHTPDEIIVEIIPGCFVSLGNAISNEWIKGIGTPTCLLQPDFPDTYHLASEIIVTINAVEVTMQEAINEKYFEGTGSIPADFSSSSSLVSKGHLATEIDIDTTGDGTLDKTLQVAINDEDLKAVICAEGAGTACPSGDATCINAGTFECDGTTCSGSYISSGTSCGTNLICDGVGGCESSCVSNDSWSCYDNDEYWYDSCGIIGLKKQECGISGYTGSNYCFDNDVYRDNVTITCPDSDCINVLSSVKITECYSAGCSGATCNTYTYYWYTGSWGTCSAGECGGGTETRSVYCRRNDGTNMGTTCDVYPGCACSTKPSSSRSCSAGSCPSGGNACDGDNLRHYWGYTCESGSCVYWEDWAIDSTCCIPNCLSGSEVPCGGVDLGSDGCGGYCSVYEGWWCPSGTYCLSGSCVSF